MHFLKGLVSLIIALLMTHAAFTQWYEVGYMRIIAPILVMCFAFCLVAFLLRKSWSWRVAAWMVVVEILINLVFWPERKYFGDYLSFAQALIGTEIGLFAILGGFMLRPKTKRWFSERTAS